MNGCIIVLQKNTGGRKIVEVGVLKFTVGWGGAIMIIIKIIMYVIDTVIKTRGAAAPPFLPPTAC